MNGKKLNPKQFLGIAIAALAAATVQAADVPVRQWVSPAWQAVQAGPSAKDKLVTHWPANTEVTLQKKSGDWCQAGTATHTGFVPCRSLHGTPLTLEELGRLRQSEHSAELYQRMFWAAPSVHYFVEVANLLNYSALSAQQTAQQQSQRKPLRFVLPQFEAMKRRLGQGLLPRFEYVTKRFDAYTLAPLNPAAEGWEFSETQLFLKTFMKPGILPPAKPSLFKEHADVLPYYGETTDALIAFTRKPATITFGGKPEWVDGHHDSGVEGLWDIGWLKVQYASPVPLLSISYAGLVEARLVEGEQVGGNIIDGMCEEGFPELSEGKLVPDYPRVNDRLVAFYLPTLPDVKKVDVLTRKKQVVLRSGRYGEPGDTRPRDVLIRSIDLDKDLAADIAVLEIPTEGAVSGQIRPDRHFFLNIAGRWWFTGVESYGECT
ncbi:MAG: hypothetical protein K0R03_2580 [Moraxellaceae bacterium]|jgi:hypothetical protein|nr:hypothetical protein [Moraxellaceae bacterium]